MPHANTPHRALPQPSPSLSQSNQPPVSNEKLKRWPRNLTKQNRNWQTWKSPTARSRAKKTACWYPRAFPVGDEHTRRESLQWAIWRRIEVTEAALARLRERQGEVVGELEASRVQLVDGLERVVQRQSDLTRSGMARERLFHYLIVIMEKYTFSRAQEQPVIHWSKIIETSRPCIHPCLLANLKGYITTEPHQAHPNVSPSHPNALFNRSPSLFTISGLTLFPLLTSFGS